MQWEQVAAANELADGQRKSVFIDDIPALVFRVGAKYYALEDVCTHDGQPLTTGPLNGCELTCPRHGARFSIETGQPLCMPATEAIRTFEVDARADGIYARPR